MCIISVIIPLVVYMNEIRLPGSIVDLAFKNECHSQAVGTFPSHDQSQDYGAKYLRSTYPSLVSGNFDSENNFPRNSGDVERQKALLEIMVARSFGAVMVRPEMYHHRAKIADFIENQGFRITSELDRSVGYDPYAVMYRDVFSREAALPSLPTRTMVYINSPSSLLVFVDNKNRYANKPIADVFCEKFKGKEAIPDANTVRGGVVLTEALRLGYDLLQDPVLQLALDPINALRNIVKLPGIQPHSHLPIERRLLKYDAVSVHVPDSTEIIRDLAVLCSIGEIEEIAHGITR